MDAAVTRVPLDLVSGLELEIVREWSPTRALERLELDGDFALVVCEEVVGGTSGLDLLNAVRAISPTTSRLLISDRFSRSTPKEAAEIVFRCVSPHATTSELRDALRDALQYHQLLATGSAQPVEAARGDRAAMRPPARPGAGRPHAPRWQDLGGAAGDVSEAVLADEPGASDARRTPSVSRVGLTVVGRTVELLPGLTVIGRSRTCHVPIPDPRVSRRHATFSNTGREVLLRNVSSTNGVRVNGVLIERDVDWVVNVGDRVTVGSNEIEVCALGDYYPSHEPTQGGGEPARATRGAAQLSTLVTLARVAEKYFQLGHVREAERISRPVLAGLLRHCEAGRLPAPGDVELATGLTLRLAEANGAGEWLDYLFSLFTALERPMPADVVDCLYRVIPLTHGMRIGCFRAYLDMLGSVEDRLGPSARFLIRRIQGLETAIMMSAHV